MGGAENGNFPLLYVMKIPLRKKWVVPKSHKTPLRNIKTVSNSLGKKIANEEGFRGRPYMTSPIFPNFLTDLLF